MINLCEVRKQILNNLENILVKEKSTNSKFNYGYILTGVGQMTGAVFMLTASPVALLGFPLLAASSLAGSGTAAYHYRINKHFAEETKYVLETDVTYVEELKQELLILSDTTLLTDIISNIKMSTKVMDAFLGISITSNVFSGYNMYALLSTGSYMLLNNALSVGGGLLSTMFGAAGLAYESGLECYINNYAKPTLEGNVTFLEDMIEKLKNNYNKMKLIISAISLGGGGHVNNINNNINRSIKKQKNDVEFEKNFQIQNNSDMKSLDEDVTLKMNNENNDNSRELFRSTLLNMRCFSCKSNYNYTIKQNYKCMICENDITLPVATLECHECQSSFCAHCMQLDDICDDSIYNMLKYLPCERHQQHYQVYVDNGHLIKKCTCCDEYIKPGSFTFECAKCKKYVCENIYCFFSQSSSREDRVWYWHVNYYRYKIDYLIGRKISDDRKIKKRKYSCDYIKYSNR